MTNISCITLTFKERKSLFCAGCCKGSIGNYLTCGLISISLIGLTASYSLILLCYTHQCCKCVYSDALIIFLYFHVQCKSCTTIGLIINYNVLYIHVIYKCAVHITTKVGSYVIKFISDLRQAGGFLRVLRFPPPIKLTATI